MRDFNTAGPVRPDKHYCIAPLDGMHSARDSEYARDFGLIASDLPLRIANPIYAEVIPRGAGT